MAEISGLPGIKTSRTHTPREILIGAGAEGYAPSNLVIDGGDTRDPDNTGNIDVLRPGFILAKMYGEDKLCGAILGVVSSRYPGSGASLTVTAQCATEINRRFGGTGTGDIVIVGGDDYSEVTDPNMDSLDHTAVNTTTGVVTITAVSNVYVPGALILDARAVRSRAEITMMNLYICADYIKVTDQDSNNIDVPLARNVVSGIVNTERLVNYPGSDQYQLQQWLKRELVDNKVGLAFSDDN